MTAPAGIRIARPGASAPTGVLNTMPGTAVRASALPGSTSAAAPATAAPRSTARRVRRDSPRLTGAGWVAWSEGRDGGPGGHASR